MRRFGEFALLERLEQGSGGTVHLARRIGAPQDHDPLLVVKRLHSDLMEHDTFVRRFSHEALIAVSVKSPNVVVVEDVGRVGDEPYIAMHFVEGLSLYEVLKRVTEAGYGIPLDVTVAIVAGCLGGLRALHDAIHPDTLEPLGVVHRDISPKNVVLAFDGQPVLIDLGLGKSNVADWQTAAGDVLGSLGYMAPEQVLGDRVDHRADLFSLSTVFYELLTLEPYVPRGARRDMLRRMESPSPARLDRADVPMPVRALLESGLSHDPNQRPASAAEMYDRLTSVIAPATPKLVAAFVRDLVGDDLRSTAKNVDDLKSQPIAFPDDTPYEGTVVIARRDSAVNTVDDLEPEGNDPTAVVVAHDRPKIADVTLRVPPADTLVGDDTDGLLQAQTRITERPAKPGVPWGVVLLLMVLVAAATVFVDRFVIGVEAPAPTAEPPPAVSATPR